MMSDLHCALRLHIKSEEREEGKVIGRVRMNSVLACLLLMWMSDQVHHTTHCVALVSCLVVELVKIHTIRFV